MIKAITLTRAIEMVVGNLFALLLMAIIIFAVAYIASKLKAKHKKPKYEVIGMVNLMWIIKIKDKRLYYNHRTKQFGRLKEASQFDSYELAHSNMGNLK